MNGYVYVVIYYQCSAIESLSSLHLYLHYYVHTLKSVMCIRFLQVIYVDWSPCNNSKCKLLSY